MDQSLYPKFRERNGRLTPYALACGYIEVDEHCDVRTVLWHEHGTLHVRQHNHATGERVFWECPRTVNQAYKLFELAKISARTGSPIDAASILKH